MSKSTKKKIYTILKLIYYNSSEDMYKLALNLYIKLKEGKNNKQLKSMHNFIFHKGMELHRSTDTRKLTSITNYGTHQYRNNSI